MAKLMSGNESPLSAIATFAERGPDEAGLVGYIASLLVGTRRSPPMPAGEQRLWEAVGAEFPVDGAGTARQVAGVARAFAAVRRESYSGPAAIAKALHVSPSRISQMTKDNQLWAFPDVSGTSLYPRWQLVGHAALRGLKVVIGAVPVGTHPLVVHHWFVSSNVDLDVEGEAVSPVGWLASGGDPAMAARLAVAL